MRQRSLIWTFKKSHAVALLFLHYCLMLACLLASLPLGSGAGSRTLCHIDTVNSDSLGAWLWEHANSKQLSIVLTFCEQGTDQGKMLSISVYFHKKTKTRRGLKQIILRVYEERFLWNGHNISQNRRLVFLELYFRVCFKTANSWKYYEAFIEY